MSHGTVTWFSASRGLGFIRSDDGDDVYVHSDEVEMTGFRYLDAGQRVAFDADPTEDGLTARRVRVES